MSNDLITLDKEYQTRDGRPVRVHATDIGGSLPVLASYLDQDGEWVIALRYQNGRSSLGKEHPLDLIEKPKVHKIVGYINVYEDSDFHVYDTRKEADRYDANSRIACKRIEFEVQEGEFDE